MVAHFTLLFLFILLRWTLWPKIYWKVFFFSLYFIKEIILPKITACFFFFHIVPDHIIFVQGWVLAFIIHLYPIGYFLTCTSFWISFFSSSIYSLNKSFPEFCFYSNMQCPFIFDIIFIAFIKKQRQYFANNGPSSQGYGFSSGHVWMWELDCEESWALKSWCFWTVVLEKTLESPLDCKEVQPVHPKGDQSWVFIGRTDAKAETPTLWPPHAKSWLIGKDPEAVRDWGQEEKRMTEDEMAGWHHWCYGHEFR